MPPTPSKTPEQQTAEQQAQPEQTSPATPEEAAEQQALSPQAQFSTYSEDDDANKAAAKMNPPDGPHVKQERGKPNDGPVKAFGES